MTKTEKACFIGIVCVTVAIDQLTKYFARRLMFMDLGPLLSLRYIENSGAAWSIMQGHATFLGILGIVAMVVILLSCKNFTNGWQICAAGMILGGIIGNTIDRFWHKYVIDFICFDLKFYQWPAFNIADSALCVGVAIFLFTFLAKPQEAN